MISGGPTGSMGRSNSPAVTSRVWAPSESSGRTTQRASARHRATPARAAAPTPARPTTASRRVAVSSRSLARARSASRACSSVADAKRKASNRCFDSASRAGVAAFAPFACTEAMSGSAAARRHSSARYRVSFRAFVNRESRPTLAWRRSTAAASSARPRV